MKLERELRHDADAVHLAEGWIGLCATCGWVGQAYGSEEQARTESARHVAEATIASPCAGGAGRGA